MIKSSAKACAQISQTDEFVYGSYSFPFNLKIASTISKKIEENYMQLKQQKQIQLTNATNKIILSKNSIKDFILFCQYQPIEINNNNIVELNYLANEYDVPQLTEITNQYIIQHNELILKQFLYSTNLNRSDNNIYEKTISERLSEFIYDDDLLQLPISSLYRIILKSSNIDDENKFQLLCKCLKKYKKQASTLFANFNFSGDNKKYLIKLIKDPELSKYFDLTYIKSEIIISLFNSQEKKIEEMKQEVFEQNQNFENYKKNHKIKLVHALYIIPPNKHVNTKNAQANPFDINFIHKLNNKDVFICVDTYLEDKITEIIKNSPNFLESYDVIIFGNGDGGGRYKKNNYALFDLVHKFRDNGGSVLMLHDFNVGDYRDKNGKEYAIFKNDLGFIEKFNFKNEWHTYSECSFNPPELIKNDPNYKISDLMSFPYKIGQNQKFDVVCTHETPKYNEEFKIIEFSDNPDFHYYSENPEKRIADCSMGHNYNLSENEKKLLFNIIYHLSQLP